MRSGHSMMALRRLEVPFNFGTVSGLTDRQLLDEFASRRDALAELAFDALVQRHGPMVLRTCRGILRDHHASEDSFQATFLILARKAGSLWVRDSVGPWLHGVACRVASTARSAEIRRRSHEQRAASRETTSARDETSDDIRGLVHEEIARLPHRYRIPIVLCDLEERTYEEAARELGWPIGTIKSRLARGRQRLRSRLIRRGIAPAGAILPPGFFTKARAGVSTISIDATVRLATGFASGAATAGAIPAAVQILMEGVLKIMFLSRLKLTALLLIGCGLLSTSAFWIGSKTKAAGPGSDPIQAAANPDAEPEFEKPALEVTPVPAPREAARISPARPSPWETIVRINVLRDRSVGFGSGTVIHSTPERSIILTAAHHFNLSPPVPPDQFPDKIRVALFSGKPKGTSPIRVGYLGTVKGELIDCDFARDVGLVRIRPGRKLPASPIVPPRWQPTNKPFPMKMLTIGCSEGRDPTEWFTRITNPLMRGLAERPEYEAIECTTAPKQGRAGGGLFTSDSYLAGVCNFADPTGDRGLYAAPRSIYGLLDRNDLKYLYDTSMVMESDLDELLRTLEKHLENHDREQLDRSLTRLNDRIEERRRSLQAELESLDNNYSRRRDEVIRRAAEDRLKPLDPPAPVVSAPEDDHRASLPDSSDYERRLQEVEQKLERVLRSLPETRQGRSIER